MLPPPQPRRPPAVILFLTAIAAACGGAAAPTEPIEGARAEEASLIGTLLPGDEIPAEVARTAAPRDGAGVWHLLAQDSAARMRAFANATEMLRSEFGMVLYEARRSIVLPVPATWSRKVSIPPRATLALGTRAELPELGMRFLTLRWSASFRAEGASEASLLWETTAPLRPPSGGDWADWRIDLEKLAGRTGTLELRAEVASGEAPPELRAVFGAPTISSALDERPNVLFISVDTLRRDALSIYGGREGLTPAIEALARSGVIVDWTWASSPWTLPAYASLFTGEQPTAHGAGCDYSAPAGQEPRPMTALRADVPSLVSVLDDAGYRTQAFYQNLLLEVPSGLAQGFDGYVCFARTSRFGTRLFDDWRRRAASGPWFCFFQLLDPHSPYVPPEGFPVPEGTPDPESVPSAHLPADMLRRKGVPERDREGMKRLYESVVAYVDACVAELVASLERRGELDRTLIVFHADHGEELWDHDGWFHGHSQHVELVAMPLVFSMPGVLPAGARVEGHLRGIDVLPTVLDLLDLPVPLPAGPATGTSRAALLLGTGDVPPTPAVSEAVLYGDAGERALTDWPWRLLVDPSDPATPARLYRLDEDPREARDRASEEPQRVADMRAALQRLVRTAEERAESFGEAARTPDSASALRALGYAGD